MQELDQYLNWCDQMYNNTPHCQCGNACTNASYCHGVQTDCYFCIKRVHNYRNNKVHYNCYKQAVYYALKHTYRFGAEVFFELSRLRRSLISWQNIYIASIGCGPCTELFGALSFWRTLGNADNTFHFRGFDIEPLWLPMMNQVMTYFPETDAKAVPQDVFSYYNQNLGKVDMIILNYMLSDMRKFNGGQYSGFIGNLITFIRQVRPCYLLVNDIYLSDSIAASQELLKAVKISGLTCKVGMSQYHYYDPRIGMWGHLEAKQPFAMSDANIVSRYNPFPEVNSIQTIISFQ